jgi:hypothetical protein
MLNPHFYRNVETYGPEFKVPMAMVGCHARSLKKGSKHNSTAGNSQKSSLVRASQASALSSRPLNIRKALEDACVIFVDENGEGPGVRLKKTRRP